MNIYFQISIATIFGGTAGALISYFTKLYFTERIKASIKNEYDDKIESLKSELSKNETAIESALASQTQGVQIGQKETIESLKIFWEHYLLVRQVISPIATIDSYVLEEEFDLLFTEKWEANEDVPTILKRLNLNMFQEINSSIATVEKLRPFLNTNLWILFNFHTTFAGRIIFLYHTGVLKKRFTHWKNDNTLLDLVKENLTENEFNFINSTNLGSIKAVHRFIEENFSLKYQGY
jgi:hypothetical protein